MTTWAAAAEALGMPGPMGTRCARACTRSLLISAHEWQTRIWTAIHDVDRRDYRATEAKIQHRLHLTSRWFQEWARQWRPGTRYTSVTYGLTWQWVHVAHAQIDLSPAWRGKKPTARDRALYRQFADSLNSRQQFELTHTLHKRG